MFNAITKQAVLEAMKHPRAIDRRAGRCLSGPPRARLSGRLHALAGAVAQAARRPLGRPRAVGGAAAGLRPRARDREIRPARILVAGRDAGDAARRHLRGPPGRRRRPEDPAPRHRLRRRGRGVQAGARDRRLQGRLGRGEAGPAQSAAAVHDLDAAAGSEPQARLCAGAHHAARAAALRRHRHRRRDGRPHHLYANRRRRHGPGGGHRHPPHDRQGLRRRLRPRRAAHLSDQVEERAGSARSDPPDRRRAPPARCARAISRSTRPSSTS